MSRIGAAEDAILERVRARFGATLRQVATIPSSWDEEMVKRMLIGAPGVYLSWGIQRGQRSSDQFAELTCLWEFTVITAHEGKEDARRRGDARAIGAYEIVERLIPLMHGWAVPNESSLVFEAADNKFSDGNERRGLTVYGVLFSMPMTMGDTDEELSDLDPFLRFHADWDQAPADGQLEAQDEVTLPQDPP